MKSLVRDFTPRKGVSSSPLLTILKVWMKQRKSLTGIARNITMPVMYVMPICLVQSVSNFVPTTMANLRQLQANLSLVR